MNTKQCASIVFFVAASFMALGVAHAAVEADPASAVRGSLGVSLESLSLSSNGLGKLVFLLNGGFALLSGVVAGIAVTRRQREPTRDHEHVSAWRSGSSATSI